MSKKINFTNTTTATLSIFNLVADYDHRIRHEQETCKADIVELSADVCDLFEVEELSVAEAENMLKFSKLTDEESSALVGYVRQAQERTQVRDVAIKPLRESRAKVIKRFVPNDLYNAYLFAIGYYRTEHLSDDLFFPRLAQWFKHLGYEVPEIMSEHAVRKSLNTFEACILGKKGKREKSELEFKQNVYAVLIDLLTDKKGVLVFDDNTNTYSNKYVA